MTLLELRNNLKTRLGDVGATGYYSDNELNMYINRGLSVMSELFPIPDEQTLSFLVGTNKYALDPAIVDVRALVLSSGANLRSVYAFDVPRAYNAAGCASGGVPNYYIKSLDAIYVYPTPTVEDTGTLYFSRCATPLLFDVDEVESPEKMGFLILHYAAYLVLTQLSVSVTDGDSKQFVELAGVEIKMFNDGVRMLRGEYDIE